jgi:hypothetical protein
LSLKRLAFDSNAAISGKGELGELMEGIHFVTNEKGKKVAVQIDLERYGELWEDIHDQLVAASRAHEKSIAFEGVARRTERRRRQARG